ncbi:MAG: TIGR03790 family protein [Planctomycetota bacterium]|nr:TIGR03790 family protein [Planctomycetota bacterium]
MPRTRFEILATLTLCASAVAGGSSENVLLVIDPASPVSLYVGNYYRAARSIPDRNVVYFAPNPGHYASFKDATQLAFLGALENQGVADHIDYVVLTPGIGFQMSASGLVTDGCSPVTRFSTTAPFALARAYASVPVGTSSTTTNQYASTSSNALAFDANQAYANGAAVTNGTRYFLSAMLGYDGALGNTVPEILALIDNSVVADESHPTGTFYMCQTTDSARSGPRHGLYPAVTSAIQALGFGAQHLMAVLPPNSSTCTGIMTGWADPLIDTTLFTFLPGAFADHLTSYAATFDTSSQTKMSRWIAKGASGTSGTVEEPCNYAGKFPTARLHLYYAQGASLGEAWYRSLGFAPFQVLFTGDPLTRPFAHLPQPTLVGLPASPVSGTIALTPSATTPHPTAAIASFELLVDGVSFGTTSPGHDFALDTTRLADGWHEVRLLAFDDTAVKSTGHFVGSFVSANHARTVSMSLSATSGSLTQQFGVTLAASGAAVSTIDVLQGGRVVASSANASAVVGVFGRTLGSGLSRLQARARFVDGTSATSAPIQIDVSTVDGPAIGNAPIVFSYTKRARNDSVAVIELPATFDDPLANALWNVSGPPSQGTLLMPSANAPYRFVKPSVGALGTDSLTFSVTTPSGSSVSAIATIVWEAPVVCTAPANYCAATVNSTGLPATMGWFGSTRFAENAFGLSAYNLPVSTLGIYFYGDTAVQIPFGNGVRCVDGALQRLAVLQADSFGSVNLLLDFNAPPFASGPGAIGVSSTKRFQFWLRDVLAGGSNFNLTDGLAVTFCP